MTYLEKINVAIIGCGYIANGHLRSWNKVPDANVSAVVDLNTELAEKTAETWKIDNYYGSTDELLENEHPDVIDICTPPQVHRALAVQSIKKGINTLIEKPMTMTVEDSEKILEAEKQSDVTCGVIHNWLFEPPVPQVRKIVNDGELGEIFHVDLKALNTRDDWMAKDGNHWCHRLQGGRFGEMLTHPIYLVKEFLGDVKLENLHVSKIGPFPWMKSDELVATLSGGDKYGSFYATFNSPRQAIILNLYGEKALLSIDMINGLTSILPPRQVGKLSVGLDSLRQSSQILASTLSNVGKVATGNWMTGHDLYIQQYAKALQEGTPAPVSIQEGYEVIKILDQMIKELESQEQAYK